MPVRRTYLEQAMIAQSQDDRIRLMRGDRRRAETCVLICMGVADAAAVTTVLLLLLLLG